MTAPTTPRETRNGETLSQRVWALLEASYVAAGLDPDVYLVVTHGSWDHYSGSGSTHDGGGAADLRTWNLPASARADLCRSLVTELRRRAGLAVWYRDATHGGMDPHIHVIVRDEPGLASGAVWQVGEADAGRNGLSNGGPDYHPRPAYTGFTYPPAPAPTEEDTVSAFIFKSHRNDSPDGKDVGRGRQYVVLGNGKAFQIENGYVNEGLPVLSSATEGTDKAFFAAVEEYGV